MCFEDLCGLAEFEDWFVSDMETSVLRTQTEATPTGLPDITQVLRDAFMPPV